MARWALPLAAGLLLTGAGAPEEALAQWVLEPGTGWVDVTLFHQDTRERFDERAERTEIFADGRTVSTSLFVTAALGLVRGVDAWVETPLHHLRFDDAAGERRSSGIGDVRAYLRVGPEAFGLPDVPLALRAGPKLPSGDFDLDAEVVPLGEGQVDWEVMLEGGLASDDGTLHASGWVGHRFRRLNDETVREPGDEWFWFGQISGPGGPIPVSWRVGAEGLHGGAWIIEGLRIPSARRRLVEAFAGLAHSLGRGEVEVGMRTPLSGRNMPAGTIWSLSYFVPWSAWGD